MLFTYSLVPQNDAYLFVVEEIEVAVVLPSCFIIHEYVLVIAHEFNRR